jgi:hypothetical protein
MNTQGAMEVCRQELLTSALDGGEWSASRPGRFTPWETITSINLIRWVAPKGGLDPVVKTNKAIPIAGHEGL